MAKPVQHISDINNHGKMQRPPRVLIVDDNGAQLNMFAQRAHGDKSGLFYGVEPVFAAYGFQSTRLEEGVQQLNTLDDIVAFANDPANGIDAVICDLYDAPEEISPEQLGLDPALLTGDVSDVENALSHLVPFGLTVAHMLKSTGFGGPVALYCSHHRPIEQVRKDAAKAETHGAIGLFEAVHFAEDISDLSAFAAVIEAVQRGREPDRLVG